MKKLAEPLLNVSFRKLTIQQLLGSILLRITVVISDHREGDNFKFKFSRMGQWHSVLVDGVLPAVRRANPSKSNEWWVPLAEKAYAKLNQSYDNIHWVRMSTEKSQTKNPIETAQRLSLRPHYRIFHMSY